MAGTAGRRWRAMLVGVVVASIALPLPAMSGQAQAAPADPAAAATAKAVAKKVTSAVRAEVAADDKSTFWVILGEQADLSAARAEKEKDDKAAEVYRSKTEFARSTQAGLRKLLDNRKAEYTPFWISNSIKVTGNAKLLGEIATRSEVARIEADTTVALPKPIKAQRINEVNAVEWNIDRVNAPRVWNELGVRGEGIVVANIDSGVNWDHPALVNKYRGKNADGSVDHNYNWFDPARICSTPAPCDNNNHGTHTMGTMVGDDGTNQVGVAPGAKWIAAKGCETSGCSRESLLASGQWVLAPTNLAGTNPRPDLAPDVVNNSWGSAVPDPWYDDVVSSWVAAGIFPSFSNGNGGPSCNTSGSPGIASVSYSSGAFDINNAIASFSSRGAGQNGDIKPNIAAPGANVRSSIPGGFGVFSGTSMAAPHTSAIVALIWSASPALHGNIAETRRLLDTTAIDVDSTTCGGTAADNNVFGEGRIDAYAAVSAAPRGALGALGGTVTSGGQPLAGATITADGPIDRTTTTGTDGKYSFPTVSVGEYAVKASKFGYTSATGTATVTEGGTATLDLSVAQAPSATLSGVVRTSAGPAAGAAVELLGTPLATKTDDAGRYTLTAPAGEYDVRATHAYRCADPLTQKVNLTADTTLNLTLPDRVDDFGYACGAATGAYPNVDTKLDLAGDDVNKVVDLPFAVPFYGVNYSRATISTNGNVAFGAGSTTGVNSTIPSTGTPNGALYPFWDDLDVDAASAIYTGVVGTAPHRAYVVEWRNVSHYTDDNQRLSVAALISEDGSIVYRYKDVAGIGLEAGSSATIGLENAAGTVGFTYSYNTATVSDDLALAFRTTKSGVLRGVVTDANDAKPVSGAKVTVKSGETVVGTSTTGADGAYLLQVDSGNLTVTTEATAYEPKTTPVTLAAGSVVGLDASMRTARVTSTPGAIEIIVPVDETRTRTVELANTGAFETAFTAAEDAPWLGLLGSSGTLRPGAKAKVTLTVSAADLTAGTHHVTELRVTSASGRNPVLSIPVRIVVPGYLSALDSGNQRSHVDVLGDTWKPDQAYRAGSSGYLGTSTVVSTRKPIAGTTDPARFADARENGYEYRFDGLAEGVYTVELDFAELRDTKPNKRVFDVLVEGVEVLPSLDIALEAGSFTATNRTYTVRVTDGQLNVRFITHKGFGKPIVNALRVTHRPDKS